MWQLLYYNWDVRFVGLYAARSDTRNINSLCPGPDWGTLWHWNSNPAPRCRTRTEASNLIIHRHRSALFVIRRECIENYLDNWTMKSKPLERQIYLFIPASITNKVSQSLLCWLCCVLSSDYRLTIICFHIFWDKQNREEEGLSFQIHQISVEKLNL